MSRPKQIKKINYDSRRLNNPAISVIIVAFKTAQELFDCLDGLARQDFKNFETIIVDNDACDLNILQNYEVTYIQLDKNYGPSAARNIGAKLARAPLLLFLDDDAIPASNLTVVAANSMKVHVDYCALRGRIIPKNDNYFNKLAHHYNLGNDFHPAYLDIEGNCVVRASAYKKVGGYSPQLFGAEGLDLSFRLHKIKAGKIGYEPDMVIEHDFVDSWRHYVNKMYRHGRNAHKLRLCDEATVAYARSFDDYYKVTKPYNFYTRFVLFGLYSAGRMIGLFGKITAEIKRKKLKF